MKKSVTFLEFCVAIIIALSFSCKKDVSPVNTGDVALAAKDPAAPDVAKSPDFIVRQLAGNDNEHFILFSFNVTKNLEKLYVHYLKIIYKPFYHALR